MYITFTLPLHCIDITFTLHYMTITVQLHSIAITFTPHLHLHHIYMSFTCTCTFAFHYVTYIHTYITYNTYITHLHYIITLHDVALHYMTLPFIALHYIFTLHHITLHYVTYIHYIPCIHYIQQNIQSIHGYIAHKECIPNITYPTCKADIRYITHITYIAGMHYRRTVHYVTSLNVTLCCSRGHDRVNYSLAPQKFSHLCPLLTCDPLVSLTPQNTHWRPPLDSLAPPGLPQRHHLKSTSLLKCSSLFKLPSPWPSTMP